MQITTSLSLATDYSGAAAASGLIGFTGTVAILLVVYGVISFFVPVFIYRIMRRNTQSYVRLGEIRDLLRRQGSLNEQVRAEKPNRDPNALYLTEAEILEGEKVSQEWAEKVKKK
jgi:hypothetical protein